MLRRALVREYVRYVETLQAAAGCITPARFVATSDARRSPQATHELLLGRLEGVSLRGMGGGLRLSAGQHFNVASRHDTAVVTTVVVAYWYKLATADGTEILAWHWTPDVPDPSQRRWPHVHVGHAVLGGGGTYLPGSFGRLHVPTAIVPFAAVVRFTIEELGVAPIRGDWQAVLSTQPEIA
jgi:hypothetical protein